MTIKSNTREDIELQSQEKRDAKFFSKVKTLLVTYLRFS